LLEGNQLLRIQTRQIGVDLDVVIVAIVTFNRADPGVLEGPVTFSDTRQLQVPVDEFGWLVFFTSQDLPDLREDTGGGKALEAQPIEVGVVFLNSGLDGRRDRLLGVPLARPPRRSPGLEPPLGIGYFWLNVAAMCRLSGSGIFAIMALANLRDGDLEDKLASPVSNQMAPLP
jgi:hypothetical protein